MKHFYLSLILFMAVSISYAQKTIVISGGDLSNSNFSVSYSIGQTAQQFTSNSSGLIAQGVQQPFEIFEVNTLDLKNLSPINLELKLYPNPTSNLIHLSFSKGDALNAIYQLYDLQGRLLKNSKIKTLETSINLNNYPSGSYFLNVLDSNKKIIKTFKIIKN